MSYNSSNVSHEVVFKPASRRCSGVEMGKEAPYVLRVACIGGCVNFVSANATHAVKLKNWKEYGCE